MFARHEHFPGSVDSGAFLQVPVQQSLSLPQAPPACLQLGRLPPVTHLGLGGAGLGRGGFPLGSVGVSVLGGRGMGVGLGTRSLPAKMDMMTSSMVSILVFLSQQVCEVWRHVVVNVFQHF